MTKKDLTIDWYAVRERLQQSGERYPILKIEDGDIYLLKFLSDLRQINTTYGTAEAVDVEVLSSNREDIQNGRYTIFVSQVVLERELKQHQPLTGKTLVVANLGRQQGKRYKLYRVVTPDEAGLSIP